MLIIIIIIIIIIMFELGGTSSRIVWIMDGKPATSTDVFIGDIPQSTAYCSTNLERETIQPLPTADNLWSLSAAKLWIACIAQVADSAIWVLHAMLIEFVNTLCWQLCIFVAANCCSCWLPAVCSCLWLPTVASADNSILLGPLTVWTLTLWSVQWSTIVEKKFIACIGSRKVGSRN